MESMEHLNNDLASPTNPAVPLYGVADFSLRRNTVHGAGPWPQQVTYESPRTPLITEHDAGGSGHMPPGHHPLATRSRAHTSNQIRPTINDCFVETTWDALLLIQGCLNGQLIQVESRPHAQDSLVRSGHVYIYEETTSGIKRWTDGVTWSPSRVLGNFLIYRELEKNTPQAERKSLVRNLQKNTNPNNGVKKQRSNSAVRLDGINMDAVQASLDDVASNADDATCVDGFTDEETKSLLGALTNTYQFKRDGIMMKKTISVKVDGFHHHLISYYDPLDVKNGSLRTPSDMFQDKFFPGHKLASLTFKVAPLDELSSMRPDISACVHQYLPPSNIAAISAVDMGAAQHHPHHHHPHPHMAHLFSDHSMQGLGYLNPLPSHPPPSHVDLFGQFQFPSSPAMQQHHQQPLLSEPQFMRASQRAMSYPNEAYSPEHAHAYSISNQGSTHMPFPRHPDSHWPGPGPG